MQRRGYRVANQSWFRKLQLCLTIALISTLGGFGSISAHQRGDASLPGGDVWTDLAEDFVSPDDESELSAPIEGDVYVLPSSGTEVVVGSGVSADDPADSDIQDQILLDLPMGIGAVAVLQGLSTPINIMESYVGGFGETLDSVEEIDINDDGDFASGLYLVDIGSGTFVYLFITVDGVSTPGFFVIQAAVVLNIDAVADSIVLLRENVHVNAQPMFIDVDEQEIQELADLHPAG